MEINSVNIFATGPSFGKLDLKQFESPFHVNFCIKQTAFDVPWEPDFIYWQDPEWWWEYKERLLPFVKTSVLMACDGLPSEDRPVEYYERSMLMGLDMEPGFIALYKRYFLIRYSLYSSNSPELTNSINAQS